MEDCDGFVRIGGLFVMWSYWTRFSTNVSTVAPVITRPHMTSHDCHMTVTFDKVSVTGFDFRWLLFFPPSNFIARFIFTSPFSLYHQTYTCLPSLRPSLRPVFDCFQYVKPGNEAKPMPCQHYAPQSQCYVTPPPARAHKNGWLK